MHPFKIFTGFTLPGLRQPVRKEYRETESRLIQRKVSRLRATTGKHFVRRFVR